MPKIMVVDDQPVFREAMERALVDSGMTEFLEFVEAENGLEALELTKAHEDIRFAVVDIHMPVMNGIEFIRRFRTEHSTRFDACHVFVITTEASRTLRAEMKELGVLAWLVKPVDPKLFIKTLQMRFRDVIEQARTEAAPP
ncbi:MAG: response regulator [Nannocystaceae bacterium]